LLRKAAHRFAGSGSLGAFRHPAQDGPFRNVEAKHLQLTMNPWRAPGWIVRNHAEDEFAEFNADALPAGTSWMAREPGPIQLEAGPVPSHNGLRLNENQCLPPPGPEPPQYHPEKSVGNSKPRMRTSPFQDSKLLPESQILQEEIAARTEEHDHRNRQQLHQAQHARSCTRRQSGLETLIVMIQQQIAILASDSSEIPVASGMAIQVDVIPQSKKYFSTRMEDGLVVADAELRAQLKESARDCYFRCQKRRAFMSDVLGVELPEEVLPLSNTCAIVPPFFLSPNTVMALET
jgi:hypothetical protein